MQVLCTGEFSGALGSEGTDAALREYFRVSQGRTLPRPTYNALKNKKKYRAALLHRCVAALRGEAETFTAHSMFSGPSGESLSEKHMLFFLWPALC